jgi:hypothetical protein
VSLIDIPIVVAMNVLYLYLDINYSSNVRVAARMVIALWNIAWSDFMLVNLIQTVKNNVGLMKNTDSLDLRFEIMITIFNNIVVAFFALSLTSSNCFKEAFTSSEAVKSFYSYDFCLAYQDNGECVSGAYRTVEVRTSYEPQFAFSFQCNSTLITSYAAVNIYMVVGSTLLTIGLFLPVYYLRSRFELKSAMYEVLDRMLPQLLRESPLVIDNDARTITPTPMFVKDKFVVQVVGKVALLLTFGTGFPPLAPVICFGIWRDIFFVQLLIGRLVYRLRDKDAAWIQSLDRECKGVAESFYLSIHILTFLVVFFYGFFIMEIYGDDVGMKRSVWAPVVMIVIPWTAALILLNNVSKMGQLKADDIEMSHAVEQTPTERINDSVIIHPIHTDL